VNSVAALTATSDGERGFDFGVVIGKQNRRERPNLSSAKSLNINDLHSRYA